MEFVNTFARFESPHSIQRFYDAGSDFKAAPMMNGGSKHVGSNFESGF